MWKKSFPSHSGSQQLGCTLRSYPKNNNMIVLLASPTFDPWKVEENDPFLFLGSTSSN